ncbi:hypothetical protein CXF68_08225 [Tenacibaculum sp. Bg11-29]|uniref:tetratricopeptide repeat protein n=1 Tax=Tenacibaculum sp. Bg11-29 TaxID=2058306 RepID=UPI000C33C45E|nr:tetratricopeptide repeat protein [Tenacibaculum sp. Bg11-29]PKH50683.1 hypothetical protein CXF68_08225 [Tenacibaculum sp. Bg11-29]
MSLEEDILIENYLKEALSESEEKDFSERMSNDDSFREKVIFEKQLFETLNESDWSFIENTNSEELKTLDSVFKSDDVKKTKEAISMAYEKYSSSKKKTLKLSYIAAASVAILIAVYSLFYTTNYSPNELYAVYIQPNELHSNISRGEESKIKDLAIGETYFNDKNYSKALPVFVKVLPENKNNASIYLYIAISQIELSKYNEAKATLDNLINSDLIDAEKGYWYKSLLFVKSNQLQEAKEQLKFVIKNSYFKHKEAKELLSKLDN